MRDFSKKIIMPASNLLCYQYANPLASSMEADKSMVGVVIHLYWSRSQRKQNHWSSDILVITHLCLFGTWQPMFHIIIGIQNPKWAHTWPDAPDIEVFIICTAYLESIVSSNYYSIANWWGIAALIKLGRALIWAYRQL